MRVLIVGGVAGGASAATRLRRLDEQAEICIIERGPHISFANCGMPYYVGGVIEDRNKLLVTQPSVLRDRFRIDVRTETEVQSIDRSAKTVRILDRKSGATATEHYDKLILSPGASPIRPPIPGVDLPEVITLRQLTDMDAIRARVDAGARHAVVVGAGFIGLEMAENLVHQGLQVTLVELQRQVLPPLDAEMAWPVQEALMRKGVRVILGQAASGFEASPGGVTVVLDQGERLETPLVLLGIGVRPESDLARAAGLAVGPRGGIQTNQHMQTSDPDIYAVGDAIETKDAVLGHPTQIPLAGPANRQGRVAADHICGKEATYRGTQGTAIVGVFETVAALTGHGAKSLERMKIPHHQIVVHPVHHAGYYPGAHQMTLKVLFSPGDGRILGAQAVGQEGVDKRIDVLAMAIQAGMTVFDLEEAELCYAPAFGSAKDPINMAGFVASNLLRGDHPQRSASEVSPPAGEGMLIDVRTPKEFEAGHVPGAENIPVDDLRGRLPEISSDQPVTVYCQVGQRGYLATRILAQHGYQVKNVSGGYKSFLATQAAQSPPESA